MIEPKDMSIAQLQHLKYEIEELLKSRRKERHIQLVGNVVDAIQALIKEFPTVSLNTEIECPDCECGVQIDLIDHLRHMGVKDFIY